VRAVRGTLLVAALWNAVFANVPDVRAGQAPWLLGALVASVLLVLAARGIPTCKRMGLRTRKAARA
jgi:hypothetical protein